MMWWNNDLKEKRVEHRRELDDIRDTVHTIDSEIKTKQNKIPMSIWLSLIVYLLGSVSGASWWAANQDATSAHTIVMLEQINSNLKEATKSRFTAKEAMTQFGIRDDAIVRLTASLETQNVLQSDMNDRIDSLEQSITNLYRTRGK